MIVDSQAHCRIEYAPELRCIIQTWLGFASSEQFRASIEKTIAFAKDHETGSILSDTRQQKLVGIEDINWLAKVGNPQLYAVGIKKLAFIMPKDQFTQMGESNYASQSKDQLAIKWFADVEQAKAWLQQ